MTTCRSDKKLVLGIDASRSATRVKTGVEKYSDEIIAALLVRACPAVAVAHKFVPGNKCDVRLYTPRVIPQFPREVQRVLWFPRLWTALRLSAEMLLRKPDVLFVPAHILPFFAPERSFTVVHDIAFMKAPAVYSRFQRWYLTWSTKRALKNCKKIIVPSLSVKADLKEIFKADAEKISVINHGVVPLPKVSCEFVREVRKKYGLKEGEPVFFFLGRIEEKKNVLALIREFSFVRACPALAVAHKQVCGAKLVLAGAPGVDAEKVEKEIKKLGLEESVICTGYISDEEVAAFFKIATAFIYPSMEEGFGLPILQSFEAGCPVICSEILSSMEVAGKAALYFGPRESGALAGAMREILKRPELRETLVAAGAERVKLFSWEKAGEEVLSLLMQG
ncbi:MAG: glycosyltransferase family 1 protein [Candidatus Gracilibacteria bacterium]|jgi:glycosyltransferase involved in cell wall biosynthesis